MDEKAELARRINFGPPQDRDSDTDSEFDEREALVTPQTPTAGGGPDLPPSYEESEAAIRNRTSQNTTQQQVPSYDNDVTVYRTEIPPDPPISFPDEKQPIEPEGDGPQASRLLNEALKFTDTPAPIAERQAPRVPVAIPSFSGELTPVRFARFYAPALYSQSVADGEFIEFIDGLNNLSIASNYSAEADAAYHAGHGNTIPEVTRDDENVRTEFLIPAYIALSNSNFFHPRGLHVQIVNLLQLAEHLNIRNEAIKKTVLSEVLRMAKTGIDVPAAANGAAHQAAGALVPYAETLTTAVPEPRKNQEALHAVASRFAGLNFSDSRAEELAMNEALERSRTSASTASASTAAGPSRAKSWEEWGNDIGRYWDQKGRQWGRWGEDFGRRVEQMASQPPMWLAGPSNRSPPGGGMPFGPQWGGHAHRGRGSHGWSGRPGGWGGRHGSVPWMPGQIGGPPGIPLPHGVVPGIHSPPPPPVIPGLDTPHAPPPPPGVPNVVGPPVPLHPPMPGAFPFHQPPPPEAGPHHPRDTNAYDNEDENVDGFEDVADNLSLSSVSSDSDSDSDDDDAFSTADTAVGDLNNPSPEVIYEQKVKHIEAMAATARTKNEKPPEQIEAERDKALMEAQHVHRKAQSRRDYTTQKREIKREVRAWKRNVKREFKASKNMDKQERRAWKQSKKADWRGFKQRLKAQERAYREERRARERERKELARAAKREGKMKAWDAKHQEWEDRRHDRRHRRGSGRGGQCVSGNRSRGSLGAASSVETLEDDVYAQAEKMLWIVVTKHTG